ncbi:MAG: hypothetical protein H8F28_24955 [Fibrella sp.]|nr:hypothetical protein [Armatimonadota bacterium]
MQAEAVYQTLFWIGTLGVVAMGAMGAMHGSHGHGHSHSADGGHGGHGLSGHQADGAHHAGAHHATGHHAEAHGHGHGNHHDATHQEGAGNAAGAMITILGYLSPMTLFSVSLGAGATGLLLGERLTVVLTAALAILAGLLFFGFVVRPAMRFIQGFASKPATNLAGTIATEAFAQNRFDAQGRGIVRLSLDGESVRLLAYLEPEDHARGVVVAPGEKLLVTRIDEGTNTCHVTKL